MLAVVSPAKKLDFDEVELDVPTTAPRFHGESLQLVARARKLRRSELKSLMKLSDPLTDLNVERFKAFSDALAPKHAKPAMLAFNGDTYLGLDASKFNSQDLAFAQEHLRILSGLYGVLRPLDVIQPYRLEMGARLKNKRGATLYDFWQGSLAKTLDQDLEGSNAQVIINLASNEYFKAVKSGKPNARVITPAFKEVKGGHAKMIGIFAKQARGMMARYMITKRITDPEKLKGFNLGGYKFRPKQSSESEWVFTRASTT